MKNNELVLISTGYVAKACHNIFFCAVDLFFSGIYLANSREVTGNEGNLQQNKLNSSTCISL